MTGDQAQLVMLCYSSQDQLHLHQRKVVADAYAWSTSEWEVGVVGATSSLYWGKALRVEHLRVLPKSRMAVGYVGAQHDHAVCRNEISPNFVVGNCFPSENPGWWIEPKYFLRYHARIRESVEMLYRW